MEKKIELHELNMNYIKHEFFLGLKHVVNSSF